MSSSQIETAIQQNQFATYTVLTTNASICFECPLLKIRQTMRNNVPIGTLAELEALIHRMLDSLTEPLTQERVIASCYGPTPFRFSYFTVFWLVVFKMFIPKTIRSDALAY